MTMMTISPTAAVLPTPAAPTTPPTCGGEAAAPDAAQGPHAFAKLLKQSRNAATPHTADKPTAEKSHHSEKCAKADKPDKPDKPVKAEKADKADTIKPTDKDDATTPTDPALADWLASLQLPDPAPPAASTGALGAAKLPPAVAQGPSTQPAATDAPVADGEAPIGIAGAGAKPGPTDALKGAHDHADKSSRESGRNSTDAAPQIKTTPPDSRDTEVKSREASANSPTAPLWTAVSSNAAPTARPESARDVSQPLPVTLPTPVSSPDFPQAMGVQLSVLAKSGVEYAELHLNPAEMGPVSVQIVVDGTQARVEFGADVAATRHAIETGLPELASALREAGLTLTGGGVSQHSRGRQSSADGSPDRSGRSGRLDPIGSGEPITATTRRIVNAGGVDLYA